MQTSTSPTFFTAIFVALGGALAEELMICCRHVRTELYIYIHEFSIIGTTTRLMADRECNCWFVFISNTFNGLIYGICHNLISKLV